MWVLLAASLALVFGFSASFLMTRASNFSPVANLSFGALFLLALATLLLLIVTIVERIVFG